MVLDLGSSLVPLNDLLLVHLLRGNDVLLVANVLLEMMLSLAELLLAMILVGLWRYLIVMIGMWRILRLLVVDFLVVSWLRRV